VVLVNDVVLVGDVDVVDSGVVLDGCASMLGRLVMAVDGIGVGVEVGVGVGEEMAGAFAGSGSGGIVVVAVVMVARSAVSGMASVLISSCDGWSDGFMRICTVSMREGILSMS